jgi:hypothetical protein
MYTIIERDIQEESIIWTDDFVNEMSRRSAEAEANLNKLNSWETFRAKAKKK